MAPEEILLASSALRDARSPGARCLTRQPLVGLDGPGFVAEPAR